MAKISPRSCKTEYSSFSNTEICLIPCREPLLVLPGHQNFIRSLVYKKKSLPTRLLLDPSGIACSFHPLPRRGASCSQESDTSIWCCPGASKYHSSKVFLGKDKHQHPSEWLRRVSSATDLQPRGVTQKKLLRNKTNRPVERGNPRCAMPVCLTICTTNHLHTVKNLSPSVKGNSELQNCCIKNDTAAFILLLDTTNFYDTDKLNNVYYLS